MTSTSTRRTRVLLGLFLIAFGVFAGQLVLTPDVLHAALRPSSAAAAKRIAARKFKAAMEKLEKEKALHAGPTRTSKRVIRSQAKTGSAATFKTPEYEKARCGDKLILLAETCDDGNAVSGDGCSSSCTIETGFLCNGGQPTACWSVCGDGVISSKEQCDDGNFTSGDGCSATCKVEIGYLCEKTPSECYVRPYCPNSVIEHGETCDDGNAIAGDGCNASCQAE